MENIKCQDYLELPKMKEKKSYNFHNLRKIDGNGEDALAMPEIFLMETANE